VPHCSAPPALPSNEILRCLKLATIDAWATASREAVAILLLLAGGDLRWARRRSGRSATGAGGIEVLLPPHPPPPTS